jgi:uncharacterized protein (TIGR02466 family)
MKVTKTDMWVTPVWEIQTDFDEQFNNELLAEVGQYYDADGANFNIWTANSPRLQELKNYTVKLIKAQTYDYIAPNIKDFEFWHTRGWLNYHRPGQGMPIHGHGSPKIAMTYYVKAPEKCGDLLLIDPRNGCDWDSGNDGVNGTKFNRIRPEEGKLVFFPGFVLHMVEPNQSSQDRISITSNLGTFDKSTAQEFKNII